MRSTEKLIAINGRLYRIMGEAFDASGVPLGVPMVWRESLYAHIMSVFLGLDRALWRILSQIGAVTIWRPITTNRRFRRVFEALERRHRRRIK